LTNGEDWKDSRMRKEKPKKPRFDPTSDDYVEEIMQAAAQGRRPEFEEDEDANAPSYDFDPRERIWVDYGIKPNLPMKVKVEQLMMVYRLDVENIADVLSTDYDTVEGIIAGLKEEWKTLGRTMTPAEREVARGQMISELLRTKKEIEEAMAGANSADKARMLTLKINVINQLNQLQNLAPAKNDIAQQEEENIDPVQAAVDAMSPEKQEALFERLRRASPH
jgi:hypothetical protein